jgi:hypothetical protein
LPNARGTLLGNGKERTRRKNEEFVAIIALAFFFFVAMNRDSKVNLVPHNPPIRSARDSTAKGEPIPGP